MRRIVLLLIVASVVMFALVLKTPLRTLRSAIFSQDDSASETQVSDKTEPSAKGARPRAKSTSSTKDRHRLDTTEGDLTSPSTSTQEEAKAPDTRTYRNLVSSPTLTISVDSAALYSINSTRGSILGLLKRGTIVVPSLQVMDGDVNWVLVRVPELKMSGFIQTEKLVSSSGG